MIKVKDGYAKLIGTTYAGSASRVLLSNGGDHILGNASGNIPLNNGTVNTNLNADLLDGLHIHTGRNNEVNKVVRTDASGYLNAGWINTTSGDMGTTTATRIYCSNDRFIRYKTPANFFSELTNSSNLLSITVGDQNRKVTVAYATNADTLDGIHANGLLTGLSSSEATNLSITIGGTTKTITDLHAHYLDTLGKKQESDLSSTYPKGLSSAGIYNSGFPFNYGSVITSYGNGGYVLLAGSWSGNITSTTDNNYATELYLRNRRDSYNVWSTWTRVITDKNYSSILDSRYYTETEVNNKLAGYLPLTGGTLTGPLKLKSEQYNGNYALNMSNSDIVNVNAIFTRDLAEDANEGLQFSRGDNTYDSIWCKSGIFYFSPNGNADRKGSYTTNHIVLHSGNYTNYPVKNPNALTLQAGTFSTKTYDGSAAITVNVPTHTSHLTNDSGYLTSRGYIGTTAVQSSSAVQNLNGIGSISMAGDISIATNGDTGIRQLKMTGGNNDHGRIAVGATASNAGWMELATADDGVEPIYVRQYSGNFSAIVNLVTLLNASGNTSFPKNLNVGGYVGAAKELFNKDSRFNYGLAYWNSTASTETGTIIITLPNGFNNSMNTYEVDIYEFTNSDANYSDKLHSKLYISGYNYSSGPLWYYYGYHLIGSYNKGVRLGYNGSKCVIMLGTTSTKWSYPQVHLSRVITGYLQQTSWSTGYSIGITTDESSYTNIYTAARTRQYFSNVVADSFIGNLSGNANSATNIYVNQHTSNDTEYPLVWSNLNSTTSTLENQLYKSYAKLLYNPKYNRITASVFKGDLFGSLAKRFNFGGGANNGKYYYVGSVTLTTAWQGYHSIWSFTGYERSWSGLLYVGVRVGNTTTAFSGVLLEWLSLTDPTLANSIKMTYEDSGSSRVVRIYILLQNYISSNSAFITDSSAISLSGTVVDSYSGTLWTSSVGPISTSVSADRTMTMVPQNDNEVNFGGTLNSATIYFGYRATDSKPIPTKFVFGGSTGTATLKSSGFIKKDGTAAQLLRADGNVATFNWSGQNGQPTWLWGGNSQHTYYVYNPSNFNVNRAKYLETQYKDNTKWYGDEYKAYLKWETATIAKLIINGYYTKVDYSVDSDTVDGFHETKFPLLNGIKNNTWDWNDVTRAGYYKIQSGTITNHPTNVYQFGMAAVLTTENHADGENRELLLYYPHNQTDNIAIWGRMHNNFTQGKGWGNWWGIPNTEGVKLIINTYYWANVKISATSSNTTTPTFKSWTTSAINLVSNTNGGSDIGMRVTGKSNSIGFIIGSSNANRGIYDYTNSAWILVKDASNNIIIPSGNVGISTSSPSQKLHVNGDIFLNNYLYFTDSAVARIKYGTHTATALGSYPLPYLGSKGLGLYVRPSKSTDEGGIIITEDTCMIFNAGDIGWNFQVHNTDLKQTDFSGTEGKGELSRTFGVTEPYHYAWSRGGFLKNGSSDSYVLLGGGGHKALSDFSMSHSHPYSSGGNTSYNANVSAAGWVRIASTSSYNAFGIISMCHSYSNNATTGVSFIFNTGYLTNSGPSITLIGGTAGLFTKARIVRATTSANVSTAYIEVYYNSAKVNTLYINITNARHTTLLTSYTAGAIPTNYTSYEFAFCADGISANTMKFGALYAPTTSGGTTYGLGTSGQVLKSNGTTVYWASDNNSTYAVYGKTINGSYKTAYRTLTKGNTTSGYYISAIRCDTASVAEAPLYGSGIAFGMADTHGYLYMDYLSANAYIGAGNADKLRWTATLLHSSNYSSFLDSRYVNVSGDTMTGDLKFGTAPTTTGSTAAANTRLPSHIYRNVYDTSGNVYDHYYNTEYKASTNSYANLRVKSGSTFKTFSFGGDGRFTWDGNRVWHAGNDGSGSGLDADTVDGLHVSKAGNTKPWGTIVSIGTDGVSEMGRSIDFHYDNTTGSDYSTRILCSSVNNIYLHLPSLSGTLALIHDIDFRLDSYVKKSGDWMSGTLNFGDNIGLFGQMAGGTDHWEIKGSGTSDNGRLKIQVHDNATTDAMDFEFVDWSGDVYRPLTMTGLGAEMIAKPTPGSWISGKTEASIKYQNLTAIDSSSFWKFYSMKSQSGNVVCYGGLGNTIGFYGYYAATTANRTDWSFTVNTANGNWTASASLYAAHFYENSDEQLKTNIQEILNSDKMPIIKEFDWKEDNSHSYGLIAQELEELGYSELVSVKDDGYKTVNYSAALSLIVGKLQVKIKELEKEIENLKNKN